MDDLYSATIKELYLMMDTEELPDFNKQDLFSFYQEKWEKLPKDGKNIKRNHFNDLPLGGNLKVKVKETLKEELNVFIELIILLKKLSKRFKELILKYEYTHKRRFDYINIYENLEKVLDESNNSEAQELLKSALENLFSIKYQRSNLINIYTYFYYKVFAHVSERYKYLLEILADYLVRSLCIGIPDNKNAKGFISHKINESAEIYDFMNVDRKFTFLSFSFNDQLVTFMLFLAAKRKGITLYVDWMYSRKYDDVRLLKQNLNYFLTNTDSLLFLRSINSELSASVRMYGLFAKKQKMVRQWCSWELGNFYNNGQDSEVETHKYQYNIDLEIKNEINENQVVEDNFLLSNLIAIDDLENLN